MSRKYKFHKPEAPYFISFATVNWVEVFTKDLYFEVLAESIRYCRKEKGMQVYAYCFMPNHVHLIFRSLEDNPSGLIRDFKGFTSRKLVKIIQQNKNESRREWFLNKFKQAALNKSNVDKHQFWQHDNHPIELYSNWVIKQKIDYIHNNPVVAGLVSNPVDWKYSSAANYHGDQSVLEIDIDV